MLSAAELAAIRTQAQSEYPSECCGVVLVRSGSQPERRLYPCRNVQDELHARDPARFPRDSRTAYYIAHDNLLEIGRLEGSGFDVQVIYHSHVDAGAYFSDTDRRNALVGSEPAYPGATYVVVSVLSGQAGEARAFRWAAGERGFAEVPIGDGRDGMAVQSR